VLRGFRRHSAGITGRIVEPVRFAAVMWAYIGLAFVLGYVGPKINELFFPGFVSPVDNAAISAILSAVAAGTITLTGIVFSLVFVIVQFGTTAYSPRITRLFARSRGLGHALGVFTGTFVYSLMALRTVGMEGSSAVSALTVWLALGWLLASVTVLGQLVRVFTGLTISHVLFALSRAGRRSIDRVYAPADTEKPETGEVHTGKRGDEAAVTDEVIYEGVPVYVVHYDMAALVALAQDADALIQLPYAVGDAVRDGEPVALIREGKAPIPADRIHSAIDLERERGFKEDPRYALRLLVDMAIRALSPAINDPTTAVQALDHIEMLLQRLGNSHLEIGEVKDERGRVRIRYAAPGWEDFLRLGLLEIMQYGAGSLQVQRRLGALLRYLSRTVPADRAQALQSFVDERQALIAGAFGDKTLRAWADVPEKAGLGGAGEP